MKKQLIIDMAGLSGFASFVYGVALFSHEIAFIVAGVLLMAFAIKAGR